MKYNKIVILAALVASAVAEENVCPVLKSDTKCKQRGRLWKKTKVKSVQDCRNECEKDDRCKYFSYKESGGNAEDCMACASEGDADGHPGFKFYPMSCDDPADKAEAATGLATFAFPATKTSQFVHAFCVLGAKEASASTTDNTVYKALDTPFGQGTKLWGDRDYTAKEIKGAAQCEGGLYLQPSEHNAISKDTVISVAATPEPDKAVTICAMIEYQHKNRDGDWEKTLPALGFSESQPFQWNSDYEKMKVYCKTMGAETVEKTADGVDTCKAAHAVNVKCPHGHDDRLFRKENYSVEQCQQECAKTEGCEYYSYKFEEAGGDWQKVCMGCTSDKNREVHHDFHLYSKDCVGKIPPSTVTKSWGGNHKCARGTGDPHFTTFDGLRYDCQGQGDYILSKSLDGDFQLQSRFERVPGLSVTTHQGTVIKTGIDGEPKVEVEYTKKCELSYRIEDTLVDLEGGAGTGYETVDFIASGKSRTFQFDSGFSLKVTMRSWRGDCLLNVYLCIPEAIGTTQRIVGILGTPDAQKGNDFTTRIGIPETTQPSSKKARHEHCVKTWCVPPNANNLFFSHTPNDACAPSTVDVDDVPIPVPFDEELDTRVANADPEIKAACENDHACIVDTVAADGDIEEGLRTLEDEQADPEPPGEDEIEPPINPISLAPPKENTDVEDKSAGDGDSDTKDDSGVGLRTVNDNPPDKKKGSGSGDPHFKTWSGEKYDYHGECDLVLVDDPSFNNGQGLRVHIRTTRVKYFSYIEKAAVQIGDEVLEFDNDAENFLINGERVAPNQQHHKTMLGGFIVRRDKKAISIRLQDEKTAEARSSGRVAKIDLHTRKNGFPAVIIDAGSTDVFKGSLGLLGDWATGRKLARDGETEIEVDPVNAEAFALEWQVRDTDPMLFKEARFPQWPTTCVPPAERVTSRIGMEMARKEAEKACAHWAHDKDDCIFDVMATRDTLVAEEGHIVHLE